MRFNYNHLTKCSVNTYLDVSRWQTTDRQCYETGNGKKC